MKLDLSNDFDRTRAISYLDKLIEKGAKIDLVEFKPKRTKLQNRYLHACLGLMSVETGYTIQEIKDLLKQQLSFMVYVKNGHKFYRSTASLNTQEMTDFIDFLRAFSLENLGLYIPTSEEYYINEFEILKEVQHAR